MQSSYASAGVIKISDLLCVLKSGEKADKLTSGRGVIYWSTFGYTFGLPEPATSLGRYILCSGKATHLLKPKTIMNEYASTRDWLDENVNKRAYSIEKERERSANRTWSHQNSVMRIIWFPVPADANVFFDQPEYTERGECLKERYIQSS